MSTSESQSDAAFAGRISRREADAVVEFRERYSQPLDRGFGSMSQALSQAHPPGCQLPMDPLVPHVAAATGEGYLKLHDGDQVALDRHLPSLALPDLFHVSACLQHDNAACLRLVELVDREIAAPLVQQFRRRLSAGRAQEIVDDVLSQAWTSAQSKPASASTSSSAQRIRLERYLGLSTLKTWLYTMARHKLFDEIRKVVASGGTHPSLDLESSSMCPPSHEPRPDDDASIRELVTRLQPKLQQALESVFDGLRQRPNPRLAHVAYLWLKCRTAQVDIARWTGVTKARVSQQAREISELILNASAAVCREAAEATNSRVERIDQCLKQNLTAFVPAPLFDRLFSAYDALRNEHPILFHIAYLKWQRRDIRAIASQICDSESRVLCLTRDLDEWRAVTRSRIATALHRESGVPESLLERRIQRALDEDEIVEKSLASHIFGTPGERHDKPFGGPTDD